jgi:hypothetical protein
MFCLGVRLKNNKKIIIETMRKFPYLSRKKDVHFKKWTILNVESQFYKMFNLIFKNYFFFLIYN